MQDNGSLAGIVFANYVLDTTTDILQVGAICPASGKLSAPHVCAPIFDGCSTCGVMTAMDAGHVRNSDARAHGAARRAGIGVAQRARDACGGSNWYKFSVVWYGCCVGT